MQTTFDNENMLVMVAELKQSLNFIQFYCKN